MATAKQIEANRRNARKSTGPRTAEGKERARWNSLRHGMTAAQPVLPHEDQEAFDRLRVGLLESWQPANAHEALLVEQIALGHWRMQRAQRFEAALLKAAGTDDNLALSFFDSAQEAGYRTLFRYDSRAQSTCYRAMDHLRRCQAARRRTETATAAAAAKPVPATAAPEQLASFGAPALDIPNVRNRPAAPSRSFPAPTELASFGALAGANSQRFRAPRVPSQANIPLAFLQSRAPRNPTITATYDFIAGCGDRPPWRFRML